MPPKEFKQGIHNTVADPVLHYEYNSALNPTNEYNYTMLGVSTENENAQKWISFSYHCQGYNESYAYTQALCTPMNAVFAICNEEDEVYPLTTAEIAEAQ